MNTKKLYELDSFQQSFDAKVIACEKVDGFYQVQLDETCFFPESGGQSGDRGWLNDQEVLDTQIRNSQILHIMRQEHGIGETVHGQIDFERRFDLMQHHSGEHIFSGLAFSRYGAVNVGFHLSDQSVTLDLDQELSQDDLMALEQEVNQVIWQNYPISTAIYENEELDELNYRSKKALDGQVRLVTVEKVDCCACCAPHVNRTGQVGAFVIQSVEKYKGGIRLSILCGKRAIAEHHKLLAQSSMLCKVFSAKPDQLADLAEGLQNDLLMLKRKYDDLQLDYAMQKIDTSNQPFILYVAEAMEAVTAKRLLQTILEKKYKMAMLLIGTENEDYRFYAATREIDLKILLEQLKTSFEAKGGGNKEMIQGSIRVSKEQMSEFLQKIVNA